MLNRLGAAVGAERRAFQRRRRAIGHHDDDVFPRVRRCSPRERGDALASIRAFRPADASNTSSRLRALRDASPGLILGSHARVSPAAARLSPRPRRRRVRPPRPARNAATPRRRARGVVLPYRRSACTSDIATCTASRAGRTLSKPHSRTRASTASTSGVAATVVVIEARGRRHATAPPPTPPRRDAWPVRGFERAEESTRVLFRLRRRRHRRVFVVFVVDIDAPTRTRTPSTAGSCGATAPAADRNSAVMAPNSAGLA